MNSIIYNIVTQRLMSFISFIFSSFAVLLKFSNLFYPMDLNFTMIINFLIKSYFIFYLNYECYLIILFKVFISFFFFLIIMLYFLKNLENYLVIFFGLDFNIFLLSIIFSSLFYLILLYFMLFIIL